MYYTLTNGTLSFIMEGSEQVIALRAKVSIDKADIESVSWHESFQDWPSWHMRMPGSYLPKWVMAGSYWGNDDWDFVLARKPKGMIRPLLRDVLVIKTKNEKYRRVIIQAPKEAYEEIQAWFKGGK